MIIKSPTFQNGERIPKKYTCDGENINSPLEFEGIPENAQNLVLIVDDPDAPAGTWTHWTVWNIAPQTRIIKENSIPQGSLEGKTSFGNVGYGGPCPHQGTHRYFFKLYALNAKLNLYPSVPITDLEKAMEGHVLDSAEIFGLYSRE